MIKASDFFTIPDSLAPFRECFDAHAAPWEWLNGINNALLTVLASEGLEGGRSVFPPHLHVSGKVFIHDSVELPPYGVIEGPAFIGPDCELRPGVYIRGNVIVGRDCVLGNSCEYKNSMLMDSVETAHFNYVGDSILGTKSHLGAGVILANIRLDRMNVKVKSPWGLFDTGRRKFGSAIGDGVEIGCNSVVQPGTLIGKRAFVLSALSVGGWIDSRSVVRGSVS